MAVGDGQKINSLLDEIKEYKLKKNDKTKEVVMGKLWEKLSESFGKHRRDEISLSRTEQSLASNVTEVMVHIEEMGGLYLNEMPEELLLEIWNKLNEIAEREDISFAEAVDKYFWPPLKIWYECRGEELTLDIEV